MGADFSFDETNIILKKFENNIGLPIKKSTLPIKKVQNPEIKKHYPEIEIHLLRNKTTVVVNNSL